MKFLKIGTKNTTVREQLIEQIKKHKYLKAIGANYQVSDKVVKRWINELKLDELYKNQ